MTFRCNGAARKVCPTQTTLPSSPVWIGEQRAFQKLFPPHHLNFFIKSHAHFPRVLTKKVSVIRVAKTPNAYPPISPSFNIISI